MKNINFNQRKLDLLTSIAKLQRAIENEADAYITYSQEKDLDKKKVYFTIFEYYKKVRIRLAKENYERFK